MLRQSVHILNDCVPPNPSLTPCPSSLLSIFALELLITRWKSIKCNKCEEYKKKHVPYVQAAFFFWVHFSTDSTLQLLPWIGVLNKKSQSFSAGHIEYHYLVKWQLQCQITRICFSHSFTNNCWEKSTVAQLFVVFSVIIPNSRYFPVPNTLNIALLVL